MSDVTHILEAIAGGDANAAARLLPLVYEELRKLAAAHGDDSSCFEERFYSWSYWNAAPMQ